MRIRDLMTTPVVTVTEDTSLKEAARLMTERDISGLPVLREGKLVGVLTEADFVDRTAPRASLLDRLFKRVGTGEKPERVGDAMTPDPVVIHPYASHVEAARLMRRKRVKRLPVVDADGELVGIVSRSDVLSLFARSDKEIQVEITDRVISQVMGLSPSMFSVDVNEGVVEIEGTVTTRTEADLLTELVEGVAGVIRVDSRIAYCEDDTPEVDPLQPYAISRLNW